MPTKKTTKKKDQTAEQILITELNNQIEELQQQIKTLESDKTDQDEMVKRAQYDYINLKMDFDRKQTQLDAEKSTMKQDLTIQSVKKFLPFVETMRKSLEALDETQRETKLAEGVALMYKNFLGTLASLDITPIQALGLEPDTNLHEPVGMQPTQDDNLKGKVIQEFERGFVYTKGDIHKVITTSKVVIGQ